MSDATPTAATPTDPKPAHHELPPILSKEQMRENAAKHRSDDEWIYVPEWGTRVRIRRLDAAKNEQAVQAGWVNGQWSDFRAALARIELGCLEPVFDLAEADDMDFLCTSDPTTIFELNAAIMVLSHTRKGSIADWQNRFPGSDGEPADGAPAPDPEAERDPLDSEGAESVAVGAGPGDA